MKKILAKIVLAFLVCAFLPAVSNGQLITIGIEATVTSVGGSNLLEGKVNVGSTITGTYTYDTSSPDTNPASDQGEYVYYSSPYGVSLIVGGLAFMSDPVDTDFGIGITNNSQGDWYGFVSRHNLPLLNNTLIDNISMVLCDFSGNALSSTALPSIAPILSDWSNDHTLYISGGIGGTPPHYENTFDINAQVTSAVLIPEPISLLLLGFGLLVLKRQK
jgi:hypothetical protein